MASNFTTRRHFGQLLTGLLMLSPILDAAAQPAAKAPTLPKVPSELSAFGQNATWQMLGTGALRFFGFKAYDANLWVVGAGRANPTTNLTPNPLADKSLFALEIVYNTGIKAEEIVNVSLIEMARLRKLSDAQIKAWTADMQRTFPNVSQGDRLTGVYVPKVGTRFFFNSKLIAEINDPAFGDAFFAIWLDEGTKRAELRRALLGMAPAATAAVNN